MAVTYRVRDWSANFEKSQTRKVDRVSWIAVPVKHDGLSYKTLMRRPDGVELFAAWVLVLQVAAKCPERGTLANERGPLTPEHLELMTCAPAEVFAKALPILSSTEVGWMEAIPSDSSVLVDGYQHATSEVVAGWEQAGSALPLQTDRQTGQDRTEQDNTDSSSQAPPAERKYKFSEWDMAFCQTMHADILKIVPSAKAPSFDAWANDLRLTREADNRSEPEIESLWQFANSDDFWRQNILSPRKLREKWTQLAAKQLATQRGKPGRKTASPDGALFNPEITSFGD